MSLRNGLLIAGLACVIGLGAVACSRQEERATEAAPAAAPAAEGGAPAAAPPAAPAEQKAQ
jgi:hypothetical protein